MEYTVQFKRNSETLGNVSNISHTKKQICEEQFFNATSVAIWATYNGTKGFESVVNVTMFTTTTTPATTAAANKPGKSYYYQSF